MLTTLVYLHRYKWWLYVSMKVVCSPLQQPHILECVSSRCWLEEWPFCITFALHNNRFCPYAKRAWGRACIPSAFEKKLGVNFLFHQSLFSTRKQSKKKSLEASPIKPRVALMNSVIKTQVRRKPLSSLGRPQDLKRGRKLAWHKAGETGLFSRTLRCAALEERRSVGLMVMTVAC